MSRTFATLLIVGLAYGACAVGPVAAQTVYATTGTGAGTGTPAYVSPYASPNHRVLTVQVLASVGGRCGFATGNAPSGSFNQPDIDTNGIDQTFSFKLDCTAASRVAVVSANGGLKASISGLPTGYTDFAPYDVQLNLVGNATSATATCGASNLTASAPATCTPTYLPAVGSNFKGTASTSVGLLLAGLANNGSASTLRVKANAFAGPTVLAASTAYTDTLVVTVSPGI